MYRALANNRLTAVKMLLRSKASVGGRGGAFGRTRGGRTYTQTPIKLALTMVEMANGGGDGALRTLREYCICPSQVQNIFCDDIEYYYERSALTRSGVLRRVLRTCEPRCRCLICERETAVPSLPAKPRPRPKRELSP